MKTIAAVDLSWGIGCKDKLLAKIPEDMKYFKEMTLGKIVVMGRTTFESLPGKQPLKDRVNIILTTKSDYNAKGAVVCRSLSELFDELVKYSTDNIFVIGGESIYKQLLPYCTEAYITKIQKKYTADKYFQNLDNDDVWKRVSQSESKSYLGTKYNFERYINSQVNSYTNYNLKK